jgi:replicative DNA helicase
MTTAARSFTTGANSPDPKVIALLKQDRTMEKQSRVLAQKCLASQGAAREPLRKELEEATTKHFELRQKRRQMEIESLEKQLERVKATLDKRNNGKDLIIQRRIAKLLGEEDELAF